MARKGEAAPGTGWGNPAHPMHRTSAGPLRPYEPGNVEAVKHGARSRSNRLVMPEAEELVAEAIDTVPFLADASYLPAVRRWAVAEAWCQRLGLWVEEHGAIEEAGTVKPVLEQLRRWQERASKESDRLGLTPLARARLGRDVTATKLDVAMLMAELDRKEKAAEPPNVEADSGPSPGS